MLDSADYGIESTPNGISIRVYVLPRASADKIVGSHDGALKIALTAPPVERAANKALVEFLAKALCVPKSAVTLTSGETSRRKVVRVSGIGVEGAMERIEREQG